MTKLEADLEGRFRVQVRAAGGMVVKITAATERGVPDRMVLHAGTIYLVELKRKGEQLSPIQRDWHKRAAARGVNVVVLVGEDAIDRWTGSLVRPEGNHS